MSFLKAVAGVVALALLLVGCNVTDQNKPHVEDAAKQIVADWKAVEGVQDAAYRYEHGLDLGQQIHFQATLVASSATETKYEELIEIARKHYWKSGERGVSMPFAFYSTDNPPSGEARTSPNPIHRGYVELGDTAELEKKYGPRPSSK